MLVAGDGNEASQLVLRESGPLHLLITDVVMPGLSGAQLAERLFTVRPAIRVLYMSGYPDAGAQNLKLQSELSFIQKPFTKEKLLRRVREILNSDILRQ